MESPVLSAVSKTRIRTDYVDGTRVVQLNLPEELRKRLIAELDWTSELRRALKAVGADAAGVSRQSSYSPLSPEFDNAILFMPSLFEFYKLNLPKIEALCPDASGVQLNAFVVDANAVAFGVHNARPWSTGVDLCPKAGVRSCLFAEYTRSLHTALEPVDHRRQPLVIYEDADAEVPSELYTLRQLYKATNASSEPEQFKALEAARLALLLPGAVSSVDFLTATHYTFSRYLEKRYCGLPWDVEGRWWPLKPGQALYFSNYVPHGDSTLPLSPRARYSVDIRMFGKTKYTSSPFLGQGLAASRLEKILRGKDCIAKLLGYEGHEDLARFIVGEDPRNVTLAHLMVDNGLALYGSYNGSGKREDILVYEDGLEAHYKRVSGVLNKPPVLPKHVQDCVADLYLS